MKTRGAPTPKKFSIREWKIVLDHGIEKKEIVILELAKNLSKMILSF